MDYTKQIDRDAHYFVLMHPLEGLFFSPFGPIVYTSSNTREKWVECQIVEERYRIEDGYKIELRSLEHGYGKESFYIADFISDLKNNIRIVKKEPGMECVEEVWEEPLTSNVNLRHSVYTLKLKPNQK